jgi:two-component system response regulator HydG
LINLPLSLQVKLLRVIQERKIQHLGGAKEIKIDVRIITATNTILADEVKKGRFRDDLYYRLNEFNINLPPLREREEDISSLAKYFLEEANLEFRKKIEDISGGGMKSLLNYSWPGNVRELRNEVRRAALLTDSNYIREINLPVDIASNCEIVIPPRPPLEKGGVGGFEGPSLREATKKITEEAERKVIKETLAQAKNNKSKAAKILKIDRMTLYSKIKALGL